MKFDEIRTDLKGTAVNVGHFVGREDSVGSRHQRTLICKFHRGMLLSHMRSVRRRRLSYLNYSIIAEKQQESEKT